MAAIRFKPGTAASEFIVSRLEQCLHDDMITNDAFLDAGAFATFRNTGAWIHAVAGVIAAGSSHTASARSATPIGPALFSVALRLAGPGRDALPVVITALSLRTGSTATETAVIATGFPRTIGLARDGVETLGQSVADQPRGALTIIRTYV